MNSIFKSRIGLLHERLIIRSSEVAEIPSLTLYKMCFGYMNNDWSMVFTSVMTLVATITLVAMPFSK